MSEATEETNDDEFIYDDKEAARVIMQGVSENLRKKLRFEDIPKILDYKYEYLEMEGFMTDSIPTNEELRTLDQDALDEFVLANAKLRKIHLTKDDLLEIWAAEGDYFEGDDDEPLYVTEDAAEVVYENISDDLKEKLDIDDIVEILEEKFEFEKLSGMTADEKPIIEVPRCLDDDAMEYHIIHQCAKRDIILTYEELRAILAGEVKYLDALGLIEEDGYQKQFN